MSDITKAAQDALDALIVAYDQTCSVGRPKDWKQIKDAIDALRAELQDKAASPEDHLFEAFWDGPTDDQCADLWRRYPSLRDWHKRTFGALQDKAGEVPKGYVLASETMDVQRLHEQLVDLTREAGAVDTVIGRPEVLRNNLAALRDEIGSAANGRIKLAAQPAPVVPDGFALVPVEPTDAMVQAAFRLDLSYMPGQEGEDRAAVYRAMIAASQQKGGE